MPCIYGVQDKRETINVYLDIYINVAKVPS